jgi:hypothetical protein
MLLLIGVVCLVIGEVYLANTKQVQVGLQYSEWSYACNLTAGETYRVYISGDTWGEAFSQAGFTSAQPLNVTISSPEGGVTSLQAFYWGEAATGEYRSGTPPTIVGVTYQSVDDTGLSVVSSSDIVFMAKQNGLYNVSVPKNGGLFYTNKQPPDYIAFYHYVTPNRENYSLLAAGGGAVCTIGGVTIIVDRLRGRRVKRRRTVT